MLLAFSSAAAASPPVGKLCCCSSAASSTRTICLQLVCACLVHVLYVRRGYRRWCGRGSRGKQAQKTAIARRYVMHAESNTTANTDSCAQRIQTKAPTLTSCQRTYVEWIPSWWQWCTTIADQLEQATTAAPSDHRPAPSGDFCSAAQASASSCTLSGARGCAAGRNTCCCSRPAAADDHHPTHSA